MLTKSRSSVAIVLACLVGLGIAACGEKSDRPEGTDGASNTLQEVAEKSRETWEAFKRTASADLDAVERELEAIRKGLADFERAQVDRWADRLESARKEMAKEIAEAPEKRRRNREALMREIEEIKREVAALLEKLRSGKSAPTAGESPE
jgi:predicted transcriptional regulator